MKSLLLRLIAFSSILLSLQEAAFCQADNTREVTSEMYGNPYLIRDWSDGIVKFSSGRIVKDFRLRFDCVHNQLLLQFQGSTFAAESKVKEFVMYTSSGKKKDSLVFRKGFPPIERATENTYFQVLLEDKVLLLRLISKNIVEEKELIASTRVRGRLEDTEKYFILKDDKMIYLPPDKVEIITALPDQANALSQFINDNNLRFKSKADYIQLAKKYNELL